MPGGFRRKRARGDRRVRVDGNGLRREIVGEAGLGADDMARVLTTLDARADQLERQRRVGWALPASSRSDLRQVGRLRDDLDGHCTDVVLLATPERALGTRALARTLATGEAPSPRLHVVDGRDPGRFAALAATLDWRRTLVVVTSDGEIDPVTTSLVLLVRDRLLRDLGAVAYQRHLVVAAPASDTALGQLVHDEGFRALALADDVASHALDPAGLLPLACLGRDVAELVAGATAMLERCRERTGTRPAHLLALAALVAGPGGIRVAPPADGALSDLGLWMERRLDTGTTAAMDLPQGRQVTLVLATAPAADPLTVPEAYQDVESLGCVGGRNLAALAEEARDVDEVTRWGEGELTIGVLLPDVSAATVGEVVTLTEAAAWMARPSGNSTSLRARATRLAFGLVGRAGYEAERSTAERVLRLREESWVA